MNDFEEEPGRQLFIERFAESQQRIYAFILSLSPNWTEAEDIFQRSSVVLWRKWNSYDQDRDFLTWALGVSRLEVLKYMSEKKRMREVLSVEAINVIEARTVEASDSISERMKALQHCLDKLPKKKRSLIDRCYGGTEKILEIAQAIGVTSDALYWRIKRIREALHECVDRKLAIEDKNP